ncbi:MAG: hypothetical protein NVSMB44_07140 [Ktedonobacteraceae bacterium]
MPSWMRPARTEAPDTSSESMPKHLSAFPGQAPDGGTFPPAGLAAQSLIDEKALPSWMKEAQQQQTPASGGISASSLLRQESVPDWMRTLQQPNAAPSSSSYEEQAGYQQQPEQPEQPARPTAPNPAALGHGFSARDLIDQQSLPTWMKSQDERNASNTPAPQTGPFGQPAQSTPGIQGTPPQQSGFSASSLLDPNTLPQWMRESGQDSRTNVTPPQPSWPTQTPPGSGPGWSVGMQSNASWPGIQAPATPPQPPMSTNPGQGGGMSASSLIDANALPEWLRNASDQRSQAGQPSQPVMGGGPRQSSYPIPPRAENVRVPSRPRSNEAGSSESSEVAANVFASMLGVASAAPNYPNQPPVQGPGSMQGQYQQGSQAGQWGQPAMPSSSLQSGGGIANTPSSMGGQQAYNPMNGPANMSTSIPGTPGSGSMGMAGNASMSGMANMAGMPGYGNSFPGSNPSQAGNPAAMNSSYHPGSAAPSMPAYPAEGDGDQKNAKKRGLFGAFLDWLAR